MTPTGYVEGERALSDAEPMRFVARHSNVLDLVAVGELPSVQRLAWFNHGFMRADVRGGELQLSDLRMGSGSNYAFSFAVATRVGGGWQAIPPVDANRRQTREALRQLWQRLRNRPSAQAAADTSGKTPATSASK
jgi:inner membrane protein